MDDDAYTVLLVEDDAETRQFLGDNLCADGYAVLVAGTARDGLRVAEAQFPDLAIVDVGLPDGSGLDLVRRIRSGDPTLSRANPVLPLLMISGRGGELDRLRGFERGADDYLVKPFSYPELRARAAALLRRAEGRGAAGRLRVGPLEVDPASRTATLHGRPVALAQKEFGLLRLLASDPGRVFTKEEILRTVWGLRSLGTTRTLDSHACRLRAKLAAGGERYIINVWGVGYRLLDDSALVAGDEALAGAGA